MSTQKPPYERIMDGTRSEDAGMQKRLACDHCHARKLRCLRQTSSSLCSRCARGGFTCTYSPPLKSGRPRKSPLPVEQNSIPHRQQDGSPVSRESSPGLSTQSEATTSSTFAVASDLTPPEAANGFGFSAADMDFLYDMGPAIDLLQNLSPQTHPTALSGSSQLVFSTIPGMLHGSGQTPNETFSEINERHAWEFPILSQPDPIASTDSGDRSGSSDIAQTLYQLQQQLVQLGKPWQSSEEESSTLEPNQTSVDPVDGVLWPGQQLIDTIRKCSIRPTERKAPSRRNLPF